MSLFIQQLILSCKRIARNLEAREVEDYKCFYGAAVHMEAETSKIPNVNQFTHLVTEQDIKKYFSKQVPIISHVWRTLNATKSKSETEYLITKEYTDLFDAINNPQLSDSITTNNSSKRRSAKKSARKKSARKKSARKKSSTKKSSTNKLTAEEKMEEKRLKSLVKTVATNAANRANVQRRDEFSYNDTIQSVVQEEGETITPKDKKSILAQLVREDIIVKTYQSGNDYRFISREKKNQYLSPSLSGRNQVIGKKRKRSDVMSICSGVEECKSEGEDNNLGAIQFDDAIDTDDERWICPFCQTENHPILPWCEFCQEKRNKNRNIITN